MNPKKKSRRCRGLGLDSGLDLAISRFIYSFGLSLPPPPPPALDIYPICIQDGYELSY